jgi:hypothetical protein
MVHSNPASNSFLPVLAQFGDGKFKKQFTDMSASLMDKAKHDAEAMLLG